MLVAVTILTILTTIVYVSFQSVTDTAEMARDEAHKLRFRQFLWRNFTTNLNSVHVDPACMRPEYQFLGEDEEGAYGAADTLRFCTSLTMGGPKAVPGVLKVVTYELVDEYETEGEGGMGELAIDEGPEDAQEYFLVIREEALVLKGDDLTSDEDFSEVDDQAIERKVPISTLNFQFYDPETEEWEDEWDSVEKNRLPWAIRVMVNFVRTKEEFDGDIRAGIDLAEEPDLDLTVTLPAGAGVVEQYIDPNHYMEVESDLLDDVDSQGPTNVGVL